MRPRDRKRKYGGRRDRTTLNIEILKITMDGSKMSWITFGAETSYKVARDYVDRLVSAGLMEQEGNMYYTTEKGKQFLNTIDPVMDTIEMLVWG